MDLSNCENLKIAIGMSEWAISVNANSPENSKEILNEKIKLAGYKKEYENSGCGVDLIKDKCSALEQQISSITRLIGTYAPLALNDNRLYSKIESLKNELKKLKADYELNGCVVKVEEIKQATIKETSDVYNAMSKQRIETKSIYERNKRVFFSAIVVLVAFVLISTDKKE